MSICYLTVEEVIALHDYAVQRFGGTSGLADRGKLEASLATPAQNVFGAELYPDLWSKGAILFFLLIKNHAFIDGNKRAAYTRFCGFWKLTVSHYRGSATMNYINLQWMWLILCCTKMALRSG